MHAALGTPASVSWAGQRADRVACAALYPPVVTSRATSRPSAADTTRCARSCVGFLGATGQTAACPPTHRRTHHKPNHHRRRAGLRGGRAPDHGRPPRGGMSHGATQPRSGVASGRGSPRGTNPSRRPISIGSSGPRSFHWGCAAWWCRPGDNRAFDRTPVPGGFHRAPTSRTARQAGRV